MLRVFFFVLIATGTAVGQSPVDDIQCHGLLDWTIIEPKAHLGSSPFNSQTVALNAVDGVVAKSGEFHKCAITKGGTAKKSLTIDLHRTYLISSVKTHLRQNWRALWQNGLKVYVGPNNNTHEGNTQCGLAYIHQRDNPNYEPVFNCTPPVRGRFVFLLKSDNHEQGLQVCEVEVKAVTFDRLPSLPNACSHNASLDTTVTYHCEEGYVADGGNATSTCLKNGTWSQPSLNCRKQCPPPPPEYEEKGLTDNVRNLSSTYACPHGKGPRQQTMHCSKDGQWIEEDLESCEVLLCPDVPAPLPPFTLSMEENDDVIGSKRNYGCNDSCYELIGTESQTCVYSSDGRHAVWSSEVPRCLIIDCGPPSVVNFATSTVVDSTTCGGTATFKCDEGYEMVGSSNLTCSIIGSWGELPSCKPVRCPSPVGNSAQLQTNSSDFSHFTYSDVIQFSCKANKRIVVGSKTSRCLSTGTWSHEPPKCKRPYCLFKPRTQQNMIVKFEDNKNETKVYADGGKVKFSCKEGYELDGPKTVNCTSNGISTSGQWDSDFPTCKKITCGDESLLLQNLKRVNDTGTEYNATAFYKCATGYYPKTLQKFRCGLKGTWEPVKKREQCSPVDCGKPKDPLNGYHKKLSEYTFLGEVEFACYNGYELRGRNTSICKAKGDWKPPYPPNCKVMKCSELDPPRNGTVEVNKRNVNGTATFKCNSGYNLNGHVEAIRCEVINKVASWSHIPPTCEPKKCRRPGVPVNGEIVGEDFHYPKTIEFDCNKGYILTPAKSVWRCSENGKWEDNKKEETETDFPTCKPVDCGKPHDPLYGYHTKLSNNYKFNAEVEYACYYGYKLQEKERAVCQSTGNWDSPSPPTCEVMTCPGFAKPQFGTVQSGGRNVNDTAKFTCNSGYDLVGPKTLTCKVINDGAHWSLVPPTCKPKECRSPRVPGNGTVVGKDFHYPNTINFTCNKGYVLTPENPVWKCSENGKWKDNERSDTDFPTCKPVNCSEPSMIPDGRYEGNDFTLGNNITYECNTGFQRSARVESTCLHTGNWSLPPPQCLQILCPYLSSPDNGRTELSGLTFRSVLTFSCNAGYDVTINNEKANVETVQLKCEQEGEQERARGVWKGKLTSQPPTCQPKDCGLLPDIQDGNVDIKPSTFYPGKAHYSCNPGFQIAERGDAVRSCGTNGIWEGIEPHCEHKCATKICPSYQLCKIINNEATCVCLQRDKCSSDYNPVCGDDGKNYNNECLMKVTGCLAGNPNISVAKRGDCKYGGVCLTEKPAPPERNPCRGFFTRYYYDYTRGECKSFQYGGCFEGRNSFVSRKKCEDTCKPDPCGLGKDPGLCAGREDRWYYNSVTKRCERFDYTGCFGNENNFVSEAKCYERCEDYCKPTVITTLPPTTPPPSVEECCNHTLKGNKNICEKSKYVVSAKIVRVVKSKEGFAKYEIKITDVVKGKRKGELWDVTSLEISRVGKCSTILCPQFDVGHKFLVGGKKQRSRVVHLDRRDNYLKTFAKDKRDQLQRVCN